MQKPNNGDLTYCQSVMNLRKGNYIVLNHKPCKITHTRQNTVIDNNICIKAKDLINGEELERIFSKDDEINVPHFDIYEYDILGKVDSNKIIVKHNNQIEEFILPSKTEVQKGLSNEIIDNLLNNRKQKILVFESMGYKQIFDYKLIK